MLHSPVLSVILHYHGIPLPRLAQRLCMLGCGEKWGFTGICLYSHALSQFCNTITVSSCHRFAARLLEQGWCGTVAQMGREGVFLEADWEQHFWDEWQGSAAPDQRGLSIQVSSFRWGFLTEAMTEKKEEAGTESGEGQRRIQSYLLGWTGPGRREGTELLAWMRQGQKEQCGREIQIHLSCRQFWMQL